MPLKTLVIIPAYNEAQSIDQVVASVAEAGYDYLIVNDGSRDDTLWICREHGYHVLDLKENLGIGGAVQAGHKYAFRHGYDVDVQFDGDGQHDAGHIAALLDGIERGDDLVVGSRFLDGENEFRSSFMRRVGIRWIRAWIKLFTGKHVSDPTSGFRATGRRAMARFCTDYPMDYPEPESIVSSLKAGLKVSEVPVVMHERTGGESSIKALSSIYYMIKVSLAISIIGLARTEAAE